jgi:hypothetical protein
VVVRVALQEIHELCNGLEFLTEVVAVLGGVLPLGGRSLWLREMDCIEDVRGTWFVEHVCCIYYEYANFTQK